MAWRPVTIDDVFSEMTSPEVTMLKNIQSGPDGDKVTSLFTRVILATRGAIQAGGNQVDINESLLPDQVISDVVAIARWKWLTSFPTLKAFQTDARKVAADDATKRLDAIANGKPKTEAPLNPSSVPSVIETPAFGERHRNFTRCSQDG